MVNKTKTFFQLVKKLWPSIRTWVVKFFLKKIAPKIAGGPIGYVIAMVGEKVFDRFIKPYWDKLSAKLYATYNKFKRKKRVKKLENAKTEDEFDSAYDDMP